MELMGCLSARSFGLFIVVALYSLHYLVFSHSLSHSGDWVVMDFNGVGGAGRHCVNGFRIGMVWEFSTLGGACMHIWYAIGRTDEMR